MHAIVWQMFKNLTSTLLTGLCCHLLPSDPERFSSDPRSNPPAPGLGALCSVHTPHCDQSGPPAKIRKEAPRSATLNPSLAAHCPHEKVQSSLVPTWTQTNNFISPVSLQTSAWHFLAKLPVR